jgi:lipopolysaccharide/colanic/teichoic acid biosynthesis glycosyltransferase
VTSLANDAPAVRWKHALDRVLALGALVLFTPLMLAIAL